MAPPPAPLPPAAGRPGRPVRVLVAPDKFKGSLSAQEAADAIAAGAQDAADALGLAVEVHRQPVADGGEGIVAAALAAGYRPHDVTVTGPLGDPVDAQIAIGPDTAVVEMATASGLALLPGGRGDVTTALTAGSRGTGELVRAALDQGVDRIVLGIGGSASTDGGTGMAGALGVRFLDGAGVDLAPGGRPLLDLDRIDRSRRDSRLDAVEIVVASDVDNPLTGPRGAATVFGPQKGAGPDEVPVLDRALRRLADVLRRDVGVDVETSPGAGAAGGVGAGAMALLGARLVPGIDLVLDLVGFDAALEGTTLVVTGEGSFEEQSLGGKAPVGVARRAAAHGVPVVVRAGRLSLDDDARDRLRELGVVAAHAITDPVEGRIADLAVAQGRAAELLRDLAGRTLAPVLSDLAGIPTDPHHCDPHSALAEERVQT
jgi:glycerate 2-kinase